MSRPWKRTHWSDFLWTAAAGFGSYYLLDAPKWGALLIALVMATYLLVATEDQ